MKKKNKTKSPKKTRLSAVPEPPLPGLVEAMAKLVERLELVERKVEQVLGKVASLPSELRNAVQNSRPQQSHQHQQHSGQHNHPQRPPQNSHPQHQGNQGHSGSHGNPGQGNGNGGRKMFQAVCADCRKSCEVPFKPGDRPVYCKECFSLRKSGNQNQVQKPAPKPAVSFPTVNAGDVGRRAAVAHMNKKAGYVAAPVRAGIPAASGKAKGKKK